MLEIAQLDQHGTQEWGTAEIERLLGFRGFSPYALPNVIEVAEGIPFIELTGWDHEKLYALKGEVVRRGVEALRRQCAAELAAIAPRDLWIRVIRVLVPPLFLMFAVLGSIWAASVAAHAGGVLPASGAAGAAPEAQVAGLHTTFVIAGVIITASVAISFWGMRRERRDRIAAAVAPAEA